MIAYAAFDLATGRCWGSREHEQSAASTVKLFVASAFWRSELDPDEPAGPIPAAGSAGIAEYLSSRAQLTLGDLALLMLAVSDNAATNVLVELLGFDAVNAEIARLGLERTVLRRRMMTSGPQNLTTPADLARGLAQVEEEEPRILHALALAADSFLPFLLPAEVTVYAKSGELDPVRHEVGADRGWAPPAGHGGLLGVPVRAPGRAGRDGFSPVDRPLLGHKRLSAIPPTREYF